MNGTTPPGPAPLPDNNDKNNPMPQGAPVPPVEGFPKASPPPQPAGVLGVPTPPPSPPPTAKPLPPPPPVGAPAVPPPPGHEVDIRTMASDKKSLKSSGGLSVESKTFNPGDLTKDPAFKPQASGALKTPKSKKKIIIISIAIVIVLALAAATVFFFVLPLFSPDEPTVVVDDSPLPPPPPPQETPPTFTHESFFAITPSDTQTVSIESIELDQINAAFVAGASLSKESIREISFNTAGEFINAQDFLAITLPGVEISLFIEDFTSFVYSDGENMWPGYVFRLADGVDVETAKASIKEVLEGGASLEAFYVTLPGTPDANGFRNGSVSLIETRYLPYENANASFNYGWKNGDLILTTSFAGFQKAVELLEAGS